MAQKFLTDIEVTRGLVDSSGDLGVAGQVLSSTGSGTNWITNEANSTVVYLDEFTGDNSTVDFTLSVSVTDENITQVYIDGVYQNKDTYSVSGTTLTFSTAPPLNADIEVITFSTATTSDDLAAGSVVIPVKNTHTASIAKGEPVYITGNVGASARLQIAPADASNSAKMPSAGLLLQTLAVNAEGYVITGGYLRNITTDVIDGTSTSSNNTVYVKAGGGLTMTKPTGSNLIQNVAKVARSSGGNSGSLLVSSILRTNDVPNITNDYFWLGNSSGVATPTEFTSTARGLLSVGAEGTAAGDGDLAYNNSSGVFTYTPPVLGGLSGTTDNITEGSTNLYYTDARSRSSISAGGDLSYNSTTGVMSYTTPTTIASLSNHDTDDLSEGASNLYYTDARSRSAISVSGNAISYNSSTGVITSNYEENPTFTGNVTISGNLTVDGTQTILNTQTVEVEDNILQLNTTQGSPDTATATTSGISVYRGDGVTQASFIFDDADDTWDLTNNLVVDGNASFVGNLAINTNKFTVNATTGDSVIAGNLNFPDDKRIRLGTSNAFQIYYDTTAAAGQGGGIITGIRTYIESTFFQVGSSTKTAIAVDVNNYVILYQNNNEKLRTIGTGVDITGAINADSANISGSVTITGGTTDGLNITTSGTQDTIKIDRAATSDNAMTKYQTGSVDKWIVGLRNTGDDNFRFYSYGTSSDVLTINQADGNAIFGGKASFNTTQAPAAKIQAGAKTFGGGNGVYSDDRLGIMNNGSLTSIVNASTYNDATYPDYGLVFIQGPSTSSYNVWSLSPDGPAKGSDLNFIYQAQATNIHTGTPMLKLHGSTGNATFTGNVIITGSGSANSASLQIDNPDSNTFNHSIEAFAANLTNGESNIILVGKEGSTKNAGYLGYYWTASGNNNNFVSLGHWSADHLFRVYGDSVLSTVTLRSDVDMRAPIFYDKDDTNYYLNPAGDSLFLRGYFRVNNTTSYANAPLLVESYGGSGTTTGIGFHISGQVGKYLSMNSSGVLLWEGSTVWHAGNDGSGSGLDADLLDGIDSASFVRSDANDTLSGQYTFTKTDDHAIRVGTIRGTAVGSQAGEFIQMYERVNIGGPSGWGASNTATPSNGLSTYGGTRLAVYTDYTESGGSMRAPIFYDSNNTGYYTDPAGASILNYAQVYNLYDAQGVRFTSPGGGVHFTSASVQTGMIRIKIPTNRRRSNTMMQMTINVYQYSTGKSFTIRCGGYNYSGGNWYNEFAHMITDQGMSTLNVRFGDDGTNDWICIGETNSTWAYCQVMITDFQGGYSGTTNAWGIGWGIDFVTSIPAGHTNTRATSLALTSNNTSNWNTNLYAPIFYDSNDTGYYTDPAGESKIVKLWINNGGAGGVAWSTGLNMGDSTNYWNMIQDGGIARQRNFGTGGYDWFSSSGAQIMTLSNGGALVASGDMRAPIFYDSNDTNSYFDANRIIMRGGDPTIIFRDTNHNSAMLHVNSNIFYILRGGNDTESWATTNGYWPLTISLSNNDATFGRNLFTIGYVNAPIFYDKDNTGYYVDPHSTSNLYTIYAQSEMRAPIYYDINNTAYYTRPSTYSYMNQIWTAGTIQAGSSGTGNIYLGNNGISGSGNHFRFHTHGGATYFDMNSGTINWREGSSTRYYFYPSTASITINGTLTQYSDIRCKENIVEIPDAIDKIKSIRGVYYNRTDFNTEPTKIGVIAQEVEVLMPELILQAEDTDMKSVSYNELTAVLVQAIKEQQTIIDDLKASIETLKNQINGIN